MPAAPSDFFKTERIAQEIKAELLPRLFEVWATTVLQQIPSPEVPLVFLDAQTGLDSDDTTPAALQLLRQVYKSTGSRVDLNKGISTLYYDADPSALVTLQRKVEQLPFYHDLIHLPILLSETDDDTLTAQLLESVQPDLAFLDPSLEGIAQQLLLSALRAGRTDLIMLFNPKLLEHAIRKAKANSLWHQFLGEGLEQVKTFYRQHKNTERREEYILNCFEEIFRRNGFLTLCFRINAPDKKQTSHYLVFTAKSNQVYLRLKELLEGYSDYQEDGVPLFGANLQQQQTALFHEHYQYSIVSLAQELSHSQAAYNNRTIQHIYEKHSTGTHYTLENYKVAFEKLMRLGRVRFINPKTGQPVSKLTTTSLIRYSAKV
ncbi:hypothetical protein [Pontibacter ramchanderi]|uniref:Three-Cys-motif partner protein n=1 Tax=Pontibacter ramchanderi TaxID=1179743 RepID=A0A2N3UC01_9BACT|nr:hypothetical protein [Pontibacter ramchanderi]PKV66886.1 hypothetical protein BD749_2021 [Pontibacter ramchanderi]